MDLTDKRILCELDLDCRTPLSQLAKKIRVGRNVVEYRIKKMEQERIIQQYISTLNLGLLGYKTYRVYFKINQTKNQKEFVDFILKNKSILHFLKTEGYFDYTMAIAVKSLKELDDFLMEVRTNFNEVIKECNVSILLYTKIFNLEKTLLNKERGILKSKRFTAEESIIKIDEKDKKILKELAQSANVGIIDLSEKTGLSVDVVKYRLKQLNRSLIISNRVIVNLNKLGYHHYVIMLKMAQMTKNDEKRLDFWCLQKKNIIYYGKRIGNFDFELNAVIQDIEEFNNFFSELKIEFGNIIDSYEIIINSQLLKLNYLPF
jgi:Lrp/AsnC family transcriptional regulator